MTPTLVCYGDLGVLREGVDVLRNIVGDVTPLWRLLTDAVQAQGRRGWP